jgi:DMSO/TMAO reductase YedYZ heme-binding membrane subunit
MTHQKHTMLIVNFLVLGITHLPWSSFALYIEWILKILVLGATLYVTIHKHIMAKKRAKQHEKNNSKAEIGH